MCSTASENIKFLSFALRSKLTYTIERETAQHEMYQTHDDHEEGREEYEDGVEDFPRFPREIEVGWFF